MTNVSIRDGGEAAVATQLSATTDYVSDHLLQNVFSYASQTPRSDAHLDPHHDR